MEKIILDSETSRLLMGATEPVRMCNEKGELLGFFQPLNDGWELKERFARNEPEFTTAEVLAYLETL